MRTVARTSLLLVAFVFAWASFSGPGPVSAQTPPPDTSVAADAAAGGDQAAVNQQDEAGQTNQPPIGNTSDATAVVLDSTMAFVIVLALLLLALIVLVALFRYLRESRQDYYGTIREFGKRGVFFNPVLVNATAPTGVLETTGGGTDTFEVAGPGLIASGQGASFTARRNSVAAEGTAWTLTLPDGATVPPESATLSPSPASSVVLTATKPGVYVLTAANPGPPELVMRTVVTVQSPPVSGEDFPHLPFIGQGFGSIVGGIIVVAALVVLAATRAIDADVVGVILGALTGYLFGAGVTQNRE
jgi:hypothetical protein